jgi:hypothetical protein
MCSAAAGACLVVKLFEHVYVRTISVGCAIVVEYICLRLLGFNILNAYNRAKFSAIKIAGKRLMNPGIEVRLDTSLCPREAMVTVSETVPSQQISANYAPDAEETCLSEGYVPSRVEAHSSAEPSDSRNDLDFDIDVVTSHSEA